MVNTKNLLKMSFEFYKKYIKEYLLMLIKPILVGVLGIILMPLMFINPVFALLTIFITLPCIFYSFWRGIMITYTLNYAAYGMYKKSTYHSLKELFILTKKNEKELALWITYIAILSIIGYIPAFILSFLFLPVNFVDFLNFPSGTMSFLQELLSAKIMVIYVINTLILIPFLNYSQQAFYFKKPEEKFFNLIVNCYKRINLQGYLIALFVVLAGFVLTSNSLLIFLVLFFNVFIYGLNMFWWESGNNLSQS